MKIPVSVSIEALTIACQTYRATPLLTDEKMISYTGQQKAPICFVGFGPCRCDVQGVRLTPRTFTRLAHGYFLLTGGKKEKISAKKDSKEEKGQFGEKESV